MRFDSLTSALKYELQDLYNAELQLVEALPRMIQEVSLPALKDGLQNHLRETRNQIARLEQIFEMLNIQPSTEPCAAMKGLLREAAEIVNATGDPRVKDALIIGAAQRVEHYEMAGYGTARAFATNLGLDDVAEILQETLDEEGAADKALTSFAEDGWFSSGANTEARRAGNAY